MKLHLLKIAITSMFVLVLNISFAQIGTRFPSEKKIVKDPVTGVELVFLTSKAKGDAKIYQTHNQWTADSKWLIFRSDRVRGEAMAVNEKTGDIVQVTEGGYMGMLNVARNTMKLYFMRSMGSKTNPNNAVQIVEVDLEKLFKDSKAGTLKSADTYQKVCGITPPEIGAGGDMALDGDEKRVYFRVGEAEAAKHLAANTKLEENFGPRKMGAGPAGIA